MGSGSNGTSRDGVLQDSFHRPEVSDLVAHVCQVRFGNDTDLSTGTPALIRKTKQRPHFGDRESE